ncbi:hypothetical protein IH879_07625, partial [candidate division KSB1 bacterium]|nr:hypothetical protein [candidate division KSB1 bacterium]
MKRLLKKTFTLAYSIILASAVLARAGTITSADLTAGATGNYTFEFTLGATDVLANNEQIDIAFPAGFDVSSVSSISSTNIDGGFTVSVLGQIITITRDGTGTPISNGTFDITFGPVTNITSIGNQTITFAATPSGFNDSAAVTIVADSPSSIAVSAGDSQSATVNTAFSTNLAAIVEDQFGNPINGASVIFTAPSSGASGTFSGSGTNTETVLTNSSGVATASVFTANTIAGGPYTVNGTVSGVGTPATFSLMNTANVIFSYDLSVPGGDPVVGPGIPLQVSNAVDSFGNPTSGSVTVSFTDGQSHQVPNGESPVLRNIPVTGGSGSTNQDLFLAETGLQLHGTSNSSVEEDTPQFNMNAGDIENFTLSDPGEQTAGSSFTLSVSNARDGFNNPADGTVALS